MLVDGLFHLEPHAPGNLLVHARAASAETRAGSALVPVLLDFGLCKRLSREATLAFCAVLHAVVEIDCDMLIDAMGAIGFRFARDDPDPVELARELAALLAPSGTRERARAGAAADGGGGADPPDDRILMEGVPSVVMYWARTLAMVHSLCARLRSTTPFLVPMASYAAHSLLTDARARTPSAAASPPTPLRPSPSSSIHERVARLMHALYHTGELLGAQACLIVHGKVLVDASAGTMGTIDPRAVRTDSLFQLFSAGSPLLSTLALQEANRGALRLDTPVATVWEAFGRDGWP